MRYDPAVMRALFLLGWVLMLCAFAAAAAEVAAGALAAAGGWVTGLGELWRALSPDSFVAVRADVHAAAPWAWTALAVLLAFPGWLLFGLPGVLLAWFCRPGRHLTADEREDLKHRADSLFLYDELARAARDQAREDGYDPTEDDSVPSHFGHDLLEEADRVEVEVDDDILQEIRRMDGDTRPPEKGSG